MSKSRLQLHCATAHKKKKMCYNSEHAYGVYTATAFRQEKPPKQLAGCNN